MQAVQEHGTGQPAVGDTGRLMLDGLLALHDAADLRGLAEALPRVLGDLVQFDALTMVGDLGWSAPVVPSHPYRLAIRTPGAAPALLGLVLARDHRFTVRDTAIASLVGPHVGAAVDHVRLRQQEQERVAGPTLGVLTAREQQVLAEIAAGRTDRDIAAALHIGARTVEKHVEHIRTKLGARSRAEAVARWAGAATA